MKMIVGLTAAASATDAGINKKKLGSGGHTTLIISYDDMQDLLKIIRSLEDSGILLDGITKAIKDEVKEQKGGFLSMLLCTLGASLLGDLLTKNLFDSSKEFLDIQATIECGFTLKRVRDMIRTYSQMHRTDKYSQHSSIIYPVWLNG